MSPTGPKKNEDASENRPVLKVVPGGDSQAQGEALTSESAMVKRWQTIVVVLLSVILVLVTSHMAGPSQDGTAKNLLTFGQQASAP
mgnify:CR=1 FL=1